MSNDDPRVRALAEKITKDLANDGRLLEAGWQVYRLLCLKVPINEPADDLKEAFFAGAEHIFSSMVNMMDPEPGETVNEMKRMELLNNELEGVRRALSLKYVSSKGNA